MILLRARIREIFAPQRGSFTTVRVLHSLVHIKELQSFRIITYPIGSFALGGMMVLILTTVLA